jgi:hypothetical protein
MHVGLTLYLHCALPSQEVQAVMTPRRQLKKNVEDAEDEAMVLSTEEHSLPDGPQRTKLEKSAYIAILFAAKLRDKLDAMMFFYWTGALLDLFM